MLDVAASAPYSGLTKRNAPPRFVHLVIKVGDVEGLLRFDIPDETRSNVPAKESREPVNLGDHTWGQKRGTLVLAPRYPKGGIDGGHVVFVWREQGTTAVVSLHAWVPIEDAISALEGVVSSIERTGAGA